MNPNKTEYLDRALIKLKRKYGKDELVSTLTRQLKESEIANGKLKSEIDEIKYNHAAELEELHKKYKLNINSIKSQNKSEVALRAKINLKQNKMYAHMKEQNKKLKEEVERLRSRISDQTATIIQLKNQKK